MKEAVSENTNSVSIVDTQGNILMVFKAIKIGNLVGFNVKDLGRSGAYEYSMSEQAISTGSTATGMVDNLLSRQWVTSTPVRNAEGDIVMVVNTALDKNLIDSLQVILKKTSGEDEQLRMIIAYLTENKNPEEPVAVSDKMKRIMTAVEAVSKTNSSVMFLGESGTGKEVMARYLHHNSHLAGKPFIPVNCPAIPHELLESEFFGYERGAFTGANPQGKPGLFEMADGGTIFLDEISELPLSLQPKLLRVLESGEVQRVGGTKIIKIHVRVVSASNRDLRAMVAKALFRSDLYYRLNVFPIFISPLRERPEDIEALAHHFLQKLNLRHGHTKVFSVATMDILKSHRWPGNVRELRNIVERAYIFSRDGNTIEVDAEFLEEFEALDQNPLSVQVRQRINHDGSLREFIKSAEREYILQVLEDCGGKVGVAASRLGIHRSLLYRKLKGSS
jgi:transcriptional regulator with PAS, ATPase and Fis domain